MAGIVSATVAQIQTARDAVIKLEKVLQGLVDGRLPDRTKLGAAQITEVDDIVDAAVAALAPLNT